MEKVEIKICTGTMCHIMGGNELPELAHELQQKYSGRLVISGSSCMGYCKDKNLSPPFVEINGKRLENVSKETIIETLNEIFDHDR